MTDTDNQTPNANIERLTYVTKEAPPTKPAPALETGVLLWVRKNLFSSVTNTVLTFIGLFLVIYALIGTVNWVVEAGNWFAVSFNFRQFMVGRYEQAYEWRVSLTALFTVFTCGAAVAIWVRQITRVMILSFIIIMISVLILPQIIISAINLPAYYTTAANVPIVAGTVNESPVTRLAFNAQAGETITIRIAQDVIASEETLASLTGFVDASSNTLRNLSNNRLQLIAEQAELQAKLDEDAASDFPLLTENLRNVYSARIAAITITEPTIDLYDLNQLAVQVGILDSDLQPISDAITLSLVEDVATFQIPETGWYVLEKTIAPDASGEGVTILDVRGIYPLLQSTSFSVEANAFVDTYIRMTDFERVQQNIPRDAGAELPFINVSRNQYRGDRSAADWLRTYVAPFLQRIGFHLSLVLLVTIGGYFATEFLTRTFSKQVATQFATYLLLSIPVVVWIFVNGVSAIDAILWVAVVGMGFLARFLYLLGKQYGWDGWKFWGGNLPIISLTLLIGIVATFTIANVIGIASLPAYLLWFGFVVLVPATILGTVSFIRGEDQNINLPITIGTILVLLGAPLVLFYSGSVTRDTMWALSESNPLNWGGLLLTMLLTLYGIILAFPIGVGLALGRRSDLPAIRYFCTGYIELVRGAPFITVLFFMQLLIPLINQQLAEVPGSYRALVATIFFSAAYLAENVRGGLQSLPPGQTEAAKALGLNGWQTIVLITLPQALRAVIPALVGQFIGLFKDTSLVAIVGLTDITGFVNSMVVQAEFIGTRQEGLLFISIIYFIFSYVMGYVSRLLEASGSGSTRRLQ